MTMSTDASMKQSTKEKHAAYKMIFKFTDADVVLLQTTSAYTCTLLFFSPLSHRQSTNPLILNRADFLHLSLRLLF